jgi:hypothetical protein
MRAYIFFAVLFALLFALYFYYDKFLQLIPLNRGIKFFVVIIGILGISFPLIVKNIDKIRNKDEMKSILEKKYKAKN